MFVKRTQAGYILLITLTVVFLLASFSHYIAQAVILEYERMRNQIVDYQLWQQLEEQAQIFLQNLELKDQANVTSAENLEFIPDTLEVNCVTGIIVSRLEIRSKQEPVKLLITYSVRK